MWSELPRRRQKLPHRKNCPRLRTFPKDLSPARAIPLPLGTVLPPMRLTLPCPRKNGRSSRTLSPIPLRRCGTPLPRLTGQAIRSIWTYRICDRARGRPGCAAARPLPALSRIPGRKQGKRFERLLQTDSRNGAITEFLPAELDLSDTDLQDVLTGEGGLLGQRDKEILSGWFASGEGNTRIAQKLSETYAGTAETMTLLSGEEADYFASTTGLEVSIQDQFGTKLGAGWQEIAPILRAMYLQERDGFFQEPPDGNPSFWRGSPLTRWGMPWSWTLETAWCPAPWGMWAIPRSALTPALIPGAMRP